MYFTMINYVPFLSLPLSSFVSYWMLVVIFWYISYQYMYSTLLSVFGFRHIPSSMLNYRTRLRQITLCHFLELYCLHCLHLMTLRYLLRLSCLHRLLLMSLRYLIRLNCLQRLQPMTLCSMHRLSCLHRLQPIALCYLL